MSSKDIFHCEENDDQVIYFDDMDAETRLNVVQIVGDEAYEEAMEYFEYNTEGAWMGDRTPIFVIMKDLLTPIEPIEED